MFELLLEFHRVTNMTAACNILLMWLALLATLVLTLRPGGAEPDMIDASHEVTVCRSAHRWGLCQMYTRCWRPTPFVCWNDTEPVVCCMDSVDPREIEDSFPGCGRRHPMPERPGGAERGRWRKNKGFSAFQRERLYPNRLHTWRRTLGEMPSRNPVRANKGDENLSWPWMANIYIKSKSIHMCGGTLISQRYVLSAAHCSFLGEGKIDPSAYRVYVGSHRRYDGTVYGVESVLMHPYFTYEQAYNDISLIKLDREVVLGPNLYPVCLPTEVQLRKLREDQKKVIVTGWGKTAAAKSHPMNLQEVKISVLDQRDCEPVARAIPHKMLPLGVTDTLLCAGDQIGETDSCMGDSGGPLVMQLDTQRWIQLGIVSFGFGCALPNYPGVYTRVSQFIEWIYANSDLYEYVTTKY